MKRHVLFIFFAAFIISGYQVKSQFLPPPSDKHLLVNGIVKDTAGYPLEKVSIHIKGTNHGVSTDGLGHFVLQVPADTVLIVSHVGYQTQEIAVKGQSNISVVLHTQSSDLNDVVVVGYGNAKKVNDLVGSIATINIQDLENKPVANLLDAVQGKVAGLQVYSSSGEPSSTPSVRLNGVGSLGASSTPLYVLDGVPIDETSIINIDPADLASMTVLKDATATSIYGSRAANGVIIYTTKRGIADTPRIAVSAMYSSSGFTNNTMALFKSFMNTQQLTDFQVASGQRTQAQVDALLAQYHADTKWYQVYYKPSAPDYTANLNISGGKGKTTYYVAGSYDNSNGLAYRSGFKRYSMRANINSTVTNWLQTGINAFGVYTETQLNPYGANSLGRGLALLQAPYYSNKDSNGVEYPNMMPGVNAYNPKYLANENPQTYGNVQVVPIGYIQLIPIKNLYIKTNFGIDFTDGRMTAYRLPSYVASLNNGQTTEAFSRVVNKTITNTAEYSFSIKDKHKFDILGGQEFIASTSTGFTSSSSGQTDDRLILLSAGTQNITATSYEDQYAYLSYFGRLDYTLNSKYYISASVRNDQSSRFGRNVRGATFYSAGVMWAAKKEKFLSNINWLSDLSVKATYGTGGNSSIGDYDALALLGTSSNSVYQGSTGYYINSPGNDNLTWEKQREMNLGVHIELLKKISVDAEYFDRRTSSMLIDVPYPYTSGFSSITSNVGGLRNIGTNVTLQYKVIDKGDNFFTIYANFSYVNQKVTSLFQGKQYWIIPNTGVCWAVGKPVQYFYPIFAKIDPATGNPLWYLPNSDPDKIVDTHKDPTQVTSNFNATSLQQNTGINLYAPFNGGFGLSGGYKGFSITANFAFSQGKYMINNDEYFFNNPSVFAGYNQVTDVLDYWKKPGDVTRYPKYGIQFTQFDSRLIENASFLRLKELTFAYKVPDKILHKTKVIKGFNVYLTFRNIWTLTKYPGVDPEDDSNISLGAYPNMKQTAVGINLQF